MKKLSKSQQKVWDKLNYVPPVFSGVWSYTASVTPPHNAVPGNVYFDTNEKRMMVYDGTDWKAVV